MGLCSCSDRQHSNALPWATRSPSMEKDPSLQFIHQAHADRLHANTAEQVLLPARSSGPSLRSAEPESHLAEGEGLPTLSFGTMEWGQAGVVGGVLRPPTAAEGTLSPALHWPGGGPAPRPQGLHASETPGEAARRPAISATGRKAPPASPAGPAHPRGPRAGRPREPDSQLDRTAGFLEHRPERRRRKPGPGAAPRPPRGPPPAPPPHARRPASEPRPGARPSARTGTTRSPSRAEPPAPPPPRTRPHAARPPYGKPRGPASPAGPALPRRPGSRPSSHRSSLRVPLGVSLGLGRRPRERRGAQAPPRRTGSLLWADEGVPDRDAQGQPEPSPEAQPHWRTTGSSSRPIGGAAHGPPRTVSATGLGSRLPPPPLGVSEGRPRFSTAPGRERPGGNASGPTQAPPRRPDWPAPPSGKGPFRPAPGRARQSFCGMFTLETSAEFRGPRPPSLPRHPVHPVDAGRPSSQLHGQGPTHASDSPGRRAGAPRREPRRGHGSQQAKRNSAVRASRTGTWTERKEANLPQRAGPPRTRCSCPPRPTLFSSRGSSSPHMAIRTPKPGPLSPRPQPVKSYTRHSQDGSSLRAPGHTRAEAERRRASTGRPPGRPRAGTSGRERRRERRGGPHTCAGSARTRGQSAPPPAEAEPPACRPPISQQGRGLAPHVAAGILPPPSTKDTGTPLVDWRTRAGRGRVGEGRGPVEKEPPPRPAVGGEAGSSMFASGNSFRRGPGAERRVPRGNPPLPRPAGAPRPGPEGGLHRQASRSAQCAGGVSGGAPSGPRGPARWGKRFPEPLPPPEPRASAAAPAPRVPNNRARSAPAGPARSRHSTGCFL
ncbi:basic proline-rich protein-like [Ochotona curzoniae]|uniref:basic proline-rich protein-like n=1 Tax=Ochotona curzoniae TaxID=130825 RepID=UPI001B34C261|nr:basic proline-rich protein-like [Ochotona curzoniae]